MTGTLTGHLQAHWRAVYAAKAGDKLTWYQARPGLSLRMIEAARVGPETCLVDVGGGASTLAGHLVAAGYGHVTVLDLAENALEAAQARLSGKIDWVVADVTAWQPEKTFDIWHDRAVFHFLVDEAARRAYLETLDHALAPDGQAIIATFALDGPDMCSGLPVRRYDANRLGAELGPGFELVEEAREEHVTPAGKVQPFNYCRFKRQ